MCLSTNANRRNRACAINPEIGREVEIKYSTPNWPKKKVLVAGGGIAGMEAALTAANLGHSVVLCEKDDTLGGVLRCEANVPFKKRLGEYLDRQARRFGMPALKCGFARRRPRSLRFRSVLTLSWRLWGRKPSGQISPVSTVKTYFMLKMCSRTHPSRKKCGYPGRRTGRVRACNLSERAWNGRDDS